MRIKYIILMAIQLTLTACTTGQVVSAPLNFVDFAVYLGTLGMVNMETARTVKHYIDEGKTYGSAIYFNAPNPGLVAGASSIAVGMAAGRGNNSNTTASLPLPSTTYNGSTAPIYHSPTANYTTSTTSSESFTQSTNTHNEGEPVGHCVRYGGAVFDSNPDTVSIQNTCDFAIWVNWCFESTSGNCQDIGSEQIQAGGKWPVGQIKDRTKLRSYACKAPAFAFINKNNPNEGHCGSG
jgi:hypothetical protein